MEINLDLQEIDDCVTALRHLSKDMKDTTPTLFWATIEMRVERYENLADKFEVLMGDEYMEVDNGQNN